MAGVGESGRDKMEKNILEKQLNLKKKTFHHSHTSASWPTFQINDYTLICVQGWFLQEPSNPEVRKVSY